MQLNWKTPAIWRDILFWMARSAQSAASSGGGGRTDNTLLLGLKRTFRVERSVLKVLTFVFLWGCRTLYTTTIYVAHCADGTATGRCRTVGQIPQKCKETSNLMWLSMIWFISVLFVCWNLFCTIANLRIKCVTETKNVSVLFYKNVKSSFSTWLTHLTLRFLYILGCFGPRCNTPAIHT